MGRPGSALDNAVIESWQSTGEFELRRCEHFATRAAARARVPAWIEDYQHQPQELGRKMRCMGRQWRSGDDQQQLHSAMAAAETRPTGYPAIPGRPQQLRP
ncbi:MAG TPA: integrase core domain-containing protein [Streptosporangiaceae bacterium]